MKLVPNARQSWRWFSMQCMAGALAVEAAWANIPADLKSSVPDGLVTWGTIALLAMGIVGRLVDQGNAR